MEPTDSKNQHETVGQSRPTTLHGFFDAAAARWPNNVAIDVPPAHDRPERETFTYAQVERLTNALAESIKQHVTDECIVAILLPRDDERVFVAQLAILKAGAAYLCLDPSFPDDRLHFTLDDAAPVLVIAEEGQVERVQSSSVPSAPVLNYDDWERTSDIVDLADRFQPVTVQGEELAYVIYTSGTTGRPKGVMVEHRHVANLLIDNLNYFDLGSDDRVIQNSSTAYDSSIEETYMALSVGGTLVVGRDDVIRMGPDLTDWLIEERITAFCPPPTLLRTLGGAEAAARLTELRLLYVGGEALTRDIVETWAPGRRLENGYGPTECAITVTRTEIRVSDKEVTIGHPVPNNVAWILDDSLNPVADGEQGELCISGESVSRGYLNRPELTAEKFFAHPECGRIYRTGDLVQRRPDGTLLFHGRIDTQVKLRGYRVELTDIESHAYEFPGVAAVACSVQGTGGVQQLIAFCVPSPEQTVDLDALRDYLAELLPPYMVPARFEFLESLPTTTSGKLDRKALPSVDFVVERTGDFVAPRTPIEAKIATAFGTHLGLPDSVSIDDDFFNLGGDSLLAAMVISDLRVDPETAGLTMRDLYESRTVEGLGARVTNESDDVALLPEIRPKEGSTFLAHLTMFACLSALFAIGSAAAYVLGFMILPWALDVFSAPVLVLAAPVLLFLARLLWIPFGIITAVLVKRTLIGEYTPGRHAVWDGYYVRHWLVTGAARLIPWGTIAGTEFQCMALRLLGARVGKNVHIHKGVNFLSGGWDLLRIGDNVTLGRDAALRLVDYESKELIVGPITIGDGVTLETRAGVSAFTEVKDGAYITALSYVASGSVVPRDVRWHGVPGQADGPSPEELTITAPEKTWSPVQYGLIFILVGTALGAVTQLPFMLGTIGLLMLFGLDSSTISQWLYSPDDLAGMVVGILILMSIAGALVRLPVLALLCRALGRVKPGVYDRHGWTFMAIWYKDSYVEAANQWLSGTLFWPGWLRWSGMKVGPDSEISTIMEVIPELVTIEGSCFFADGIYLGGARMHRGRYALGPVHFSKNTFLGNHAIIHGDTQLPSDILIGICTVADDKKILAGTSWFGHPMFELPRREVVEVDPSLTHNPQWYRYVSRLFWESARFVIPVLPTVLMLIWFKMLLSLKPVFGDVWFYMLAVPAFGMAIGCVFAAIVVALKWCLLGKTRAGQHPLWSFWCSRWDFLYVVWGAWARPVASVFEGTLFINMWLRLFGVRIGKRVFLGAGFAQVVDPDMLHFEDDATVVNMFQAHSFEDRVLKTAPVYIRQGATVRSHAVMLYGADIANNSIVGEHSVIMKNEYLRPDRYYVGAPTRPSKPCLVEVSPEPEAVASLMESYGSLPH